MRRFSQRSSLVTLSEINITPLLDLAFVLLIIFVITTPLLTQSLKLKLPTGGTTDEKIDKRDIRTVEVGAPGIYLLDKRPMRIEQMESELVRQFKANPNLVIYLRADESSRWKDVAAVMDRCQRNGINRFYPRTQAPKR
jgi:biopolymer transport protein ExbD